VLVLTEPFSGHNGTVFNLIKAITLFTLYYVCMVISGQGLLLEDNQCYILQNVTAINTCI
jgi:hypothetical protein